MIAEYSPNISWGKQHVEITLMQWKYKRTFTVDVGGNCTGFHVLETAFSRLYDQLVDADCGAPSLTLEAENGDTLLCADEEDGEEDWLKGMCVSAQIVGWTPPTLNEVRAMNGAKPLPDGDRPWSPI